MIVLISVNTSDSSNAGGLWDDGDDVAVCRTPLCVSQYQ